MIKTYSQSTTANLSELEFESITNFLVKESIEIIEEEVGYFFLCRDKLVEKYLDGVSLDNMDLRSLRNKLNSTLYTKEEIILLTQKIENRIRRELRGAQWEYDFKFYLNQITWIEPGYIVALLREEMKTLVYSDAMAKSIDMAWIKIRKQFVPSSFNKVVSKVKMGNMALSSVNADPRKLKADMSAKIKKLIRGSIKQYKMKLCKELAFQVYEQLFSFKQLPFSDSNELIGVQTA